MLSACFRLAAAIHGYLAFYMPTNRAVDWLRTPRGLKWAIPVAARSDADLPVRHERLHDAHRPQAARATSTCS